MPKDITRVALALCLSLAVGAPLAAQAPAPASPELPAPEFAFALSGFYEINGYSQSNFFLGRGASGFVSDKDRYAIQLFRVQPEFSYGPSLKAVMRIDVAQGIWGVDDELRDNDRPGYNNLFNNKDTNFHVHLDWAYLEASPSRLDGWGFRAGRMKNQLGNLLVLDQDGDGVQVFKRFGPWRLLLDWTKLSEGVDGLTDDVFPGGLDGRDADLFYVDLARPLGKGQINPFLAHYRDGNRQTSYVPQRLEYFRARFTPNLSEAWVLGTAFQATAGRLALKGEATYLTGKDRIPNANSGPNQLLDVNDGDLRGHNVYLDARLGLGRHGTLGLVCGRGSGDDDPTSGRGNINKIRTNGFFYVTEVWEDSIMPDEEGITPQGLGSPAHRGYRELENTTLVQLNYARPLGADWKLFVAGTLLRASEALRPWRDANGNGAIEAAEFGAARSKDLGWELDAKADWTLMKNLTWTFRGGVFSPGAASGYLLNGTDQFLDNAWELRTTLAFNFATPAKK